MQARRQQPGEIGVVLACVVGLAVSVLARQLLLGPGAADFSWLYAGARFLLAGIDPYRPGLDFGAGYLDTAPLFYPLPSVLFAVPLLSFPARVAAAHWVGASASLVAWLAWRYNRLVLLVFVSAPFLCLVRGGQPVLWLLAAGLVPGLAPLCFIKPSVGAPVLFRWILDRSVWPRLVVGLAVAGIVVAISVAILPSWPLGWLQNAHSGSVVGNQPAYYGEIKDSNSTVWTTHVSPVQMLPFGPLVLLALLRWRDQRSWFLLMLGVVPQTPVLYDQVLLWLLPRTCRGALVLTIWTWLPFLGAQLMGWHDDMPLWHGLGYLGGLLVLLLESNTETGVSVRG
jgi:hypothetical protein